VRLGGIQPVVPWAELPIAFSFRGSNGVQTANTSVAGTVPWNLPGVAYDARLELGASVDGRSMTVVMTIGLVETVGGGGLLDGGDTSSVTLPIEPAPAGSC
jgi:hypothetical protein